MCSLYQALNSDSGSDALSSTETNKRPLLSFVSVIARSVEHRTSWVLSKAAVTWVVLFYSARSTETHDATGQFACSSPVLPFSIVRESPVLKAL